ncbi:MAG: DUF4131 domain-containing protein, partial [Alphaproteobacteria bacterium]
MRRAGVRLVALFESEMDAGRGFLWLPVAFGAGIASYFAWPSEPSLAVLASGAGLLIALSYAARAHAPAFRLLLILAALAAGMSVAALRTLNAASETPARETTVLATGWVAWVEEGRTRGQRLYVRIVDIDGATGGPKTVRVTVNSAHAPYRVGDGVRFRARLIPPSGPLLPGGFDFARHA